MQTFRRSPKIQIRSTKSIGKGFFAKQHIGKGEELMMISSDEFITCDCYSQFYEFSNIKNSQQISKKTLLAYFLSSIQSTNNPLPEFTPIKSYQSNLPTIMHNLICWKPYQLSLLDNQQLILHIQSRKNQLLQQFQLIQEEVRRMWGLGISKWDYPMLGGDWEIGGVGVERVIYYTAVLESRAVHFQCFQDPMSEVGALAPHLEMFNHSSMPHCLVQGCPRYIVKAIKDIEQDEEIYVTYGNITDDKLLQMYGFLEDMKEGLEEGQQENDKIQKQQKEEQNKEQQMKAEAIIEEEQKYKKLQQIEQHNAQIYGYRVRLATQYNKRRNRRGLWIQNKERTLQQEIQIIF